jgi:FkbH-like protein
MNELVKRADDLRRIHDWAGAAALYGEAAGNLPIPDPNLYLKLARCLLRAGAHDELLTVLADVAGFSDDLLSWGSAAALLARVPSDRRLSGRRQVKLALTASHTTGELGPMLRLAALARGIDLVLHEGDYGQYEQDLRDPDSPLYAFGPALILLAVNEGSLRLPLFSEAPDEEIEAELQRWRGLWRVASERAQAQVIQFNFVPPHEVALGHLTTRLAGSRHAMILALNARLGQQGEALIVDCDRLAAGVGRQKWSDPRYWYLSRQAVAPEVLPLLARNTIAVVAASLGLSKKCLVLDLDNTLWGGIVGEDGLEGIQLGAGPAGEAFVALQEYILELKGKGIVLAVVSKNNEADAREVFLKHPDMRLRLEDIALFAVNWDDKPSNLRRVAQDLNLGLDSLVFVDDSAGECELVKRELPEVDVIQLPSEPSQMVRRLSDYLGFETLALTQEDRQRTEQYRARAEIERQANSVTDMPDFYRSLDMRAVIAPFDELHLSRITQLVAKTNQFNLTTRRHGAEALRVFMADADWVALYLKLKDRFVDHGLVAVALARQAGDTLDIDSFLMSCRVIGRTVETAMLAALCKAAQQRDCVRLRGTYIPTPKNALVAEVYPSHGFEVAEGAERESAWEYDLAGRGPIQSQFIRQWDENKDDAA